ncbi:unnamed protein product [Owenia fusiformis]|uniref:PLD phosphodiesterase domain-containing protein n=1 Tax=Owenia fusiformis TaxID=6347 RepID=A0A8S4PLH8_OWEFU|nr:unnamed protein product [Owenia fusiformis]
MESPPEYCEVDPNTSMMPDLFMDLQQHRHIDMQELLSGKRKIRSPNKQDRCNKTAGYIAVCVLLLLTLPVIVIPLLERGLAARNLERGKSQSHFVMDSDHRNHQKCKDQCRVTLVESIPQNLTYAPGSPSHPSTFSGWKSLIQSARHSIDLGVFYWTLRGVDIYEDPSAWQGEDIFNELLNAVSQRGIKVRIAQNKPQKGQPAKDSEILAEAGAEVRTLDFDRFLGSGILHTKLWIVDGQHFYVGSANMDWRSLTQVKELGTVSYNCSCLAGDIQKIFDVYWYMGTPSSSIPSSWPKDWGTQYNSVTPLQLDINNIETSTYLSSSPPEFCPNGRTVDVDAILDIIGKAQKFIYIAVMDYFPTTLYTNPRRFWPVIDDALRKASMDRGVELFVPIYLQNFLLCQHLLRLKVKFHLPE